MSKKIKFLLKQNTENAKQLAENNYMQLNKIVICKEYNFNTLTISILSYAFNVH